MATLDASGTPVAGADAASATDQAAAIGTKAAAHTDHRRRYPFTKAFL
jgi:hypothetical protein